MAKEKRGFLDGYKTYDPRKGFGSPNEWTAAFKSRMTQEEADAILGDEEPCDILNLEGSSTTAEIKAAYRVACMKYHPDRSGGDAEMFKRCTAAYVRLGGRD